MTGTGSPAPDGEVARRTLLDRVAADGWPPVDRLDVDGWQLRAAAGVTLRANSALPGPYADEPVGLDEVLARVRAFYDARGLPARVQVSEPALDDALAARGWTASSPTLFLTGPLPTPAADEDVALRAVPDDGWLACWWAVDGRGGPEQLEVARRCLAGITAPARYASVEVDGRVAAVGRGVVQEGWLGVFAMAVRPENRQQGLGRRLLGAIGGWAAGAGATAGYLQVSEDNAPARALYAAGGWSPSHRYGYRTSPPAPS